MDRKTSGLVMSQATRWYARLSAPDCDAAEREQHLAWLARRPDHVRAWRQVEALAERVTRQADVDPRLQALAAQALAGKSPAASPPVAWRRPGTGKIAAAAALLLAVGVAATFATRQGLLEGAVAATTATYVNDDARQQRIVLRDGSVAYLDVHSELNVRIGKGERRLELLRGRAYFEVAHDAARPFSVSAGGARTVALGTHFQVALGERSVSITLKEGSVAICNSGSTTSWREVLRPGQQLTFSAVDGSHQQRDVDAAALVGWSRGRLIFDGTPLAAALEEVNRYATVKVHLGDASLADVPVGGNFIAGGDSAQVVAALAAVLPLRPVYAGTSEIVLLRNYETASN